MKNEIPKKNRKKLLFPSGFLWGSATSAHQVEGGTNNQWTKWEKENAERLAKEAKTKWQPWQQEKFPEMFEAQNYISGKACDHYNRFEEDFDIAKSLGHNAHRFSIEWSRIEPEEGKFDEKEIEHYRKVLMALRERGMEPFVTLWHWTNPLWLEEKGGCENPEFATYFKRYAGLVAEKLGSNVAFWITINEPTTVILNSYAAGVWPPQKRNLLSVWRVYRNLAKAHKSAFEEIHVKLPNAKVGFSHIVTFFEPYRRYSIADLLAVKIAEYFGNKKILNMTKSHNDFLALQYYFHRKLLFPWHIQKERLVSDLNWEIYAEGLYHILRWARRYKLPVYITENGLADAKDEKRSEFIAASLLWVHRAILESIDVRGYFYWSLLDNFEWDKGFWPRFGLVEVDFETQERKVRPSALEYAKICKNNELEIEI
ncbi:MAG TPA: glycoside hydrolase family 1 protein [Patescibacteria group bacterium]